MRSRDRRFARGLAAALALVACKHAASPKADFDEPDLPARPSVIDAGAAAVGDPPADDWKLPPPVKALAGAGPHAFVADGHGLVEVATGVAPASLVVTPGAIGWCNVDARGQVVWFTRDADLFAFDLVDRSVHRIVRGAADKFGAPPIISWGSQQLGGESRVDFQIALAVNLTTPPTLSAAIGCEGDAAYYCYEDLAAEPPVLNADLTAQRAAIQALAIADPGYVAAVAARGREGSLWTPPPMPPALPTKKPRVVRSACSEDESACGQLSAIPGNPLWAVVVGNSRGDFYYEESALWDPATGEYLDFSTGTIVRSRTAPTGRGDLAGLRASSNGALTTDGVVFDARRVYYAPTAGGDVAPVSCGWTDGGWRLPGPRGG